jgi:hypothetical protein
MTFILWATQLQAQPVYLCGVKSAIYVRKSSNPAEFVFTNAADVIMVSIKHVSSRRYTKIAAGHPAQCGESSPALEMLYVLTKVQPPIQSRAIEMEVFAHSRSDGTRVTIFLPSSGDPFILWKGAWGHAECTNWKTVLVELQIRNHLILDVSQYRCKHGHTSSHSQKAAPAPTSEKQLQFIRVMMRVLAKGSSHGKRKTLYGVTWT